MTDPTITVSDGTNFYRIPWSDLEEAIADGFYVPAHRGTTIVSDGKELFEIPLSDVADAETDGFQDILISEREALTAVDGEQHASPREEVPVASVDDLCGQAAEIAFAQAAAMVVESASVSVSQPPPMQRRQKNEVEPQPEPVPDSAADVSCNESESEDEPANPQTLKTRMLQWLHPGAERWRQLSVLAMNAMMHAAVIFILAAIFLPAEEKESFLLITSSFEPEDASTEDLEPMEVDQPMEIDESTPPAEMLVDTPVESMETADIDINDLELSSIETNVDVNSNAPSGKISDEMGGRSKAGRAAMVAKMGGTAASELAVQKGLEWLAIHQYPDGGWSFDHTGAECEGACSQTGTLKEDCRTAATGLAILAMLGAGHTPSEGDFQESVLRGVQFLLKNSSPVPAGLDVRGKHSGNTAMYTQAIAATALCETLAMLKYEVSAKRGDDEQRTLNRKRSQMIREIEPLAAGAIVFIVNAQHKTDGSWGYNPGESGDTSILGWQIMALKSAAHAKVPFSSGAVVGANVFLNSVQAEDGMYGYRSKADKKPSTTAIGLVSRMLSGVPRTEPRLKMGVERLSAIGPDQGNMYYNYYATQVMLNYGGETWTKWNESMREFLVSTQIREGHAAGSWDIRDPHAGPGGRLFMTCLCTMTLEVYYRHLPLYGMPDEVEEPAAEKQRDDSAKKSDK